MLKLLLVGPTEEDRRVQNITSHNNGIMKYKSLSRSFPRKPSWSRSFAYSFSNYVKCDLF